MKTCMGTHNEWNGGQTLGKYCDEVGDTHNTKPSVAWIAASVHGWFFLVLEGCEPPWLFQNNVRRGTVVFSGTSVGAQGTGSLENKYVLSRNRKSTIYLGKQCYKRAL